ncbi:MAG: hypothetical protein PHV32_15025 [Eubacteriales bacterium]|nr:hypothetical protein [Eubacteriales bacterium]
MEELISVMMEIRDQLIELNSKMDVLTGGGSSSLSDIIEAIESIKGPAGYDLTDIHSSLSNVESSLSSIDMTLTLKD